MHLVASITSHGYGHVAQIAPVLNALHQRLPQLHLTVRSNVPAAHLRSRIHAPFEHLPSEGDIGMAMTSALEIDVAASRKAYRAFHADWEQRVGVEAGLLRDLGADLLLSNIGYLPLAGAQHAGIPNVALCSLNWADIYRHYCCADATHRERGADEAIAAQIQSCYARADAFLRITPGMAMDDLPNRVPIAPIAAPGRNRRNELNERLQLAPDEKLVLASLGGVAGRLPMESWPRLPGVRWLVQNSWRIEHPDAIVLETLPLDFCDLLASSDALLCKPGYGSFAEAACNGIPVLYVERPDWPETPALAGWLQLHGVCRKVSRQALERGDVGEMLTQLWRAPRKRPPAATGAQQAAEWLAEKLLQ